MTPHPICNQLTTNHVSLNSNVLSTLLLRKMTFVQPFTCIDKHVCLKGDMQ